MRCNVRPAPRILSSGGFGVALNACAEDQPSHGYGSAGSPHYSITIAMLVIPSEVEESLNLNLRCLQPSHKASARQATPLDMTEEVRSRTAAVIPAYQDEKHIGDIAGRTRERLDHVLVVDDGSTDHTGERARESGAEVIVHDANRGKGEAIKTGLAHWFHTANPQVDWVILLDSDGQHLPEEIDRFLSAAASARCPTFFIGNRMNDLARMPPIRRVVNRYMSREISRVCGQKIPDTQCGFRMLDRRLAPQLLGGGHRFDYDTEVLIIASRKGYRIESVPITTVYSDQVSKIHPMRDALRFVKLLLRYKAIGT